MKKINLGSGLTLKATIKDNNMLLEFLDKKANMGTACEFTINTCKICKARFLSNEKLAICPSCSEIIVDFLKNDGNNADYMCKDDNDCDCKDIIAKPKKARKKKEVKYYGKAHLADNNIIIDNIVDCLNLTDGHITKARLETLLRFAIMGLAYENIAKLLKIATPSVAADYRKLARLGMISIGSVRPSVTSFVKFHIDDGTTGKVEDTSIDTSTMSLQCRAAYNKLAPMLTDWVDLTNLSVFLNMGKHTVVTYIYELNKIGLIDKKRRDKKVYYKLKNRIF